MKNIDVSAELVSGILKNAGYEALEKLEESTEVDAVETTEDEVDLETLTEEEIAQHVCPLCESFVEEGISDEAILEHLESVVEVLNEAYEEDSEEDLTQVKADLLDQLLQEIEDEE